MPPKGKLKKGRDDPTLTAGPNPRPGPIPNPVPIPSPDPNPNPHPNPPRGSKPIPLPIPTTGPTPRPAIADGKFTLIPGLTFTPKSAPSWAGIATLVATGEEINDGRIF